MQVARVWNSTIGRKFIMAGTGIFLILFLVTHLAANLLLFLPDGTLYNLYSFKLHTTQPLLNIVRFGLAAFFLFHIVTGIWVYLENRRARRDRYAVTATKGGPSKLSPASRSMMITGLILLVFVPLHIQTFALGPYYHTVIDGQEMRDLYRLVIERFNQPLYAFTYPVVMLFLGAHLRHGFWSALQSLGALRPAWTHAAYVSGLIFAVLLAGGFLVLPLYIFFIVPAP